MKHILHIRIDGDDGSGHSWPSIECENPDECGPIYHEDIDWPDATTCHCTDADCACRDGDHDACGGDFTFVYDLGPSCRLRAEKGCWYTHAVAVCGWEMLSLDKPVTFSVPVDLSGSSWESPINVAAR